MFILESALQLCQKFLDLGKESIYKAMKFKFLPDNKMSKMNDHKFHFHLTLNALHMFNMSSSDFQLGVLFL